MKTKSPIDRRILLGLLLGFVAVASFSLTLPMTRLAVSAMDAGTIAVWRGVIAGVIALVVLLAFYRRWPGWANVRRLLVGGIGIVIGFPLFITLAMQTVPSSHGAIVVGLLPISTAVVSIFVTSERPSKSFWLSSALGTLVIMTFILLQADGGLALGHLYLLLAIASAAGGYAIGGDVAKDIGGLRVTVWMMALYAPVMGVAAFFVAPVPWTAAPAAVYAFLYLALVSQFFGFFAWYAGLSMGGVARVSQVQLLQVFMTLIASHFLLAEVLSGDLLLFAALVALCVAACARGRSKSLPRR